MTVRSSNYDIHELDEVGRLHFTSCSLYTVYDLHVQ